MKTTCENCLWWVRGATRRLTTATVYEAPGQCRRYPPEVGGRWALTEKGDWCGEHSTLRHKAFDAKAESPATATPPPSLPEGAPATEPAEDAKASRPAARKQRRSASRQTTLL